MPGAGRPKGSMDKVKVQAAKALASTGLLPHEWLAKVARGEGIEHTYYKVEYDKNGNEKSRKIVTELVFPDFTTRMDAGKAAAPYYAPKLALQQVNVNNTGDPSLIAETFKQLAAKLPV